MTTRSPSPLPTLILLEDDELVGKLFKTVLEHHGYRVICAPNSKDLIALHQTWRPALVITDLIMPEHEGVEGILRLREISSVPIIAISSNTDFLAITESLVTQTITKPFTPDFLLLTVQQILNQNT